jgi:hypothetical protein
MASAWIHRAGACDILVQFQDAYAFRDAWNFCIDYLEVASRRDDVNYAARPYSASATVALDGPIVGSTPNVQVGCYMGLEPPTANPSGQFWNTRGNLILPVTARQQAIDLGDYDEPDDFVPLEFRSTDTNEARTEEDLDAELDAYRMERELIEEEAQKDKPIETPICSRRCSYCEPYLASLQDPMSPVASSNAELVYSLL